MRVEFHPEALAEFRAAAEYYEKQQAGLGNRFVNAVDVAAARIAEAPESWRIVEDDIRRCLTKVFPYAVLYSIEPTTSSLLRSCTAAANRATGATGLSRRSASADFRQVARRQTQNW